MYENDTRHNNEGYLDPTAHEAIKNIALEKSATIGTDEDKDYSAPCGDMAPDYVAIRFYKLLHTIFYLCELAGFNIEGRITVVDRKTRRRFE